LKEAIAVQRKVVLIDPLSVFAWTNLGAFLMEDGQLREARDAYKRSQEISPDNGEAAQWLAIIELLEGHAAEALAAMEKVPQEADRLMGVAMAQHDLGHAQKSQQAIDTLVAKADGPEGNIAYRLAAVHAWRGERDRAFEWLDRAYARHDLRLRWIKIDPFLRNLRGDARCTALVKRMNLPVD
jgi:tetratricopeptide (TPR) repeat protein